MWVVDKIKATNSLGVVSPFEWSSYLHETGYLIRINHEDNVHAGTVATANKITMTTTVKTSLTRRSSAVNSVHNMQRFGVNCAL